jgi:hypothetical protein
MLGPRSLVGTKAGKSLHTVGEIACRHTASGIRLGTSNLGDKPMSDNPKKTGQDRQLISLEQKHEIRSWTESLGVTEEQLRAAVAAVGHSADKVREYLRKSSGS